MKFHRRDIASQQAGFSIIELMVGLVIGMLLVLVIVQVMGVFEAQTRTTRGSADAQTNGGIALYSIGRELQMAGYSLLPVTNSALECNSIDYNATTTGFTSITPVSITDGAAGTSDIIDIRYGNSQMGGVPTQITSVGPPLSVRSNFGCQVNDISLITNGATCAFSRVTAVTGNTAGLMTITLNENTAAVIDANLACLGAWNTVRYSVDASGNLVRTLNGTATPMLSGIASLQAQYGISSSQNTNVINQWVDASGSWAAPVLADRNRIKAVRFAVVARSDKRDPAVVTTACSSLSAAAPTGLCAWEGIPASAGSAGPPVIPPFIASPAPLIDLETNDADWDHYRYRVFETIIPLRNVIWSKDTL